MFRIVPTLAFIQRDATQGAANAEPDPAAAIDQSPSVFIASTAEEARDGMIVLQDWRLENYQSNPVILYNHDDRDHPIGKGEVWIEGARLMVRVLWDWPDPEAAKIAGKVKRGFLNAVSIRWKPEEVIARWRLPREDVLYAEEGYICRGNELLEISVVTIPADPQALVVERGAREDLDARIRAAVAAEMARQRPALVAAAVAEVEARALTAPAPAPEADWFASLPADEPDWLRALPPE